MNIAIPSSTNAATAIDGLHASLMYLDETKPSTTHVLNTELQGMVRWEAVLVFRTEIKRYWESLVGITRTQDLPGLDTLFESFPTLAHLYEAAIFTFRNILTGSEPDSLGNAFALCSLAYIASICSRRMGKPGIDNIFRDINIWRDSIGDLPHRQLFSDLIERLWPSMSISPFQTEQSLHSASQLFNGPDYIAPQSATMQGISLFGNFSDPFWGGLFDMPHPTVYDTPDLQPSAEDLRQSAVMNIMISFLTNCGELMDILSGHGATKKGPHSNVSVEVKNFTWALRRHDSFEDPSARGILAIVDRFVDLDYFQSIDEIRDYIIIVAKEILPSGKSFAKVCKSVYSSTNMTKVLPARRRHHTERPTERKPYHVATAENSSLGRPT
ncbi:uncharacterized protein BKA55DRAFT_686360 [Fusarium redolens]|uniref:Uncharacterized protein n=1 Tax=Fusarium redolens TaxID=48865 RepID=A0A9P9HPE7_FUSRE|nr:uncharacterized protein BKA55DRAFT_686360 [Fusarium redolens]KAH7260777.1 hypothetical protein BKA55DRAFT_686360 [Fusarium redolens]